MSEAEITLSYPITLNGQEIATLSMRRPKVKDTRAADKAASDNAGKELYLFAYLTGCNPEDLEELDMADDSKLQDAYSVFLS